MKGIPLALPAAALILALSAPVRAAEGQRSKYVPCPRGMEGKCGDIPGAVSSAAGAGEIICEEGRYNQRVQAVRAWDAKVRQIQGGLSDINGTLGWLGNQYAGQGKRPPIDQLIGYIRDSLLARLVMPTSTDLSRAAACYPNNRRASDGCHHLACGDPEAIVRNLENLPPSINRVKMDLENKEATLLSGLPTYIQAGSAPNVYNRCAVQDPMPPCKQHMRRAVDGLKGAVGVLEQIAGEINADVGD